MEFADPSTTSQCCNITHSTAFICQHVGQIAMTTDVLFRTTQETGKGYKDLELGKPDVSTSIKIVFKGKMKGSLSGQNPLLFVAARTVHTH
jgi:hypothetical protein